MLSEPSTAATSAADASHASGTDVAPSYVAVHVPPRAAEAEAKVDVIDWTSIFVAYDTATV